MSNVTLEAIANLLEEELKPIKAELSEQTATMAEHTRILSSHTAALDTLLSQRKNKDDEKLISADRFDRLEHWAQQVGQKLGIKLDL